MSIAASVHSYCCLVKVHISTKVLHLIRQFCVGDVLEPGAAHKTWTLPAIVKRMQAAYCGTLSAELNHLATRYCCIKAKHS